MKKYLLVFLCSIIGSLAVAGQKPQPNVGAQPKRCCPNGECIKPGYQPNKNTTPKAPQQKSQQSTAKK
jgi:hypothetical protein